MAGPAAVSNRSRSRRHPGAADPADGEMGLKGPGFLGEAEARERSFEALARSLIRVRPARPDPQGLRSTVQREASEARERQRKNGDALQRLRDRLPDARELILRLFAQEF